MLPLHFTLLRDVFEQEGYRAEVLQNTGHSVVEEGLKYVHNDTCYPALLVIGQILDALKSGRYDLDHVAVAITQTGGGCRASNYIHLLRKAMIKAGFGKIPVVSLNLSGLERSGLVLTPSIIRKAVSAVIYGDMLMLLRNQTIAYEQNPGDTKRLTERWLSALSRQLRQHRGLGTREIRENLTAIAADFAAIPADRSVRRVKVGIVGEIYVKFSDLANNNLESFLLDQGCEVSVPGLLGFLLYCFSNVTEEGSFYGGGKLKAMVAKKALRYFCSREDLLREALAPYPFFTPPAPFEHLRSLTEGVISRGAKMGEGWLLPAEMMELIESGYRNIICAQPFGCLPNHIVGKGVLSRIKAIHPEANLVSIDYDPSATRVNQENRIKLMLAVARENLAREPGAPPAAEPRPSAAKERAVCV